MQGMKKSDRKNKLDEQQRESDRRVEQATVGVGVWFVTVIWVVLLRPAGTERIN